MTNTFKVGDKVQHPNYGTGEITYGPFKGAAEVERRYVMLPDDGIERVVSPTYLETVAAFSIGDTVSYEYGAGGKLVAGPFKTEYHDESIWVVEKADGNHLIPTQNALSKVEPAGDTSSYAYEGITYDLSARYTDYSGSKWQFANVDGTVRGGCGNVTPAPYTRTLESVVVAFGPLTKITSAPEPNPFTYAGQTYTPGVEYADKDGDTWTFELRNGEVVSDPSSYISDRTLEHVVRNYGPLDAN